MDGRNYQRSRSERQLLKMPLQGRFHQCKKAGRLCSSHCHRNNKCCKNGKDFDHSEDALLKRKERNNYTKGKDVTKE
jgi:hypothetical protein